MTVPQRHASNGHWTILADLKILKDAVYRMKWHPVEWTWQNVLAGVKSHEHLNHCAFCYPRTGPLYPPMQVQRSPERTNVS